MLNLNELSDTIRLFYNKLFTLGPQLIFLNNQISKVNSIKIKNLIQHRIEMELFNNYVLIYNSIHDPFNEFENPNEIVFHNPKKIKLLLNI